MPEEMRDSDILKQILSWCTQIEEAHNEFDRSYETFNNNSVYKNALSMCLLQIGELAIHLSDEFKKEHPEIPWHEIIGMRHRFAHSYGEMREYSIWDAAVCDVPVVERFCKKQIDPNS